MKLGLKPTSEDRGSDCESLSFTTRPKGFFYDSVTLKHSSPIYYKNFGINNQQKDRKHQIVKNYNWIIIRKLTENDGLSIYLINFA